MVDKVRLVVAGAGAFGREHLRGLSRMAGVELVGIADVNAAVAEDAATRYGAADRDTDATALTSRLRPDGLIVATPGPTHVALADHALGLDVSVLVEKPVGVSAAQAASLVEAEARSSGFVLPGHILRFSEPHRRFVQIAQSGAIGPILSVTARRHRDDSHAARYPDDPVLMTMIHDIDLALWITGAGVRDVLAARHPAGLSRSETLVLARGARGAVWRLSTAWTFPIASCPPDRIEVMGERGSVELEVGRAIRSYCSSPQHIDIGGAEADQPLATELSYFVACIRNGVKPKVVTSTDAVAGLRVTDAVLASLRTGGMVQT
jgi:predicted dehydrogenase